MGFAQCARSEGGRRLARAFERAHLQGRGALVGYWMAGFPDPPASRRALSALARGGCDVLEVGVPFSDPVADGPVLQQAAVTALQAGTTLRTALEIAGAVQSEAPHVPVVVMSYYNPLLQMGEQRAAEELARRGLAGVVVPDLPVEEAGSLREALVRRDLAWVSLAAPTSGRRLALLTEAADGFVYAIARAGVTGVREDVASAARELVEGIRRHTGLPVAVGFGVSGPEQARAYRFADGVVVGSAFVLRWMAAKDPGEAANRVEELAGSLRRALGES